MALTAAAEVKHWCMGQALSIALPYTTATIHDAPETRGNVLRVMQVPVLARAAPHDGTK